MANGRFIAYYRVSTARQGRSGLGLSAQRDAVRTYLNGGTWTLTSEFTEVESGKKSDRAQLALAMAECRLTGATLLIAKLDRLARNVHFISGLMESGVEFVAVDMPTVNRLTVHILAAVAEEEARMISARTKAALAQSKKQLGGWRGGPVVNQRLGADAVHEQANAFAASVRPVISMIQMTVKSYAGIAAALNARGIRTARGGAWHAATVRNVVARSID